MTEITNITTIVAFHLEALEAAKAGGLTWQDLADQGAASGLWPEMGSTELSTRVLRIRKSVEAGKRPLPHQRPLPFLS
ncbi:hypothetical protein BJI67_16415 (plasmid) [Acidihalobacter aeolianus]|uniref:Uncharacterized protein n=1 Tax=Acidihalobacter aeolianus TaxID=2792603 RepID=A0A1D8KD07_9GAMM|nr:hypothetical protein BJI67_16415 [Acidihalobacter aeolianus]